MTSLAWNNRRVLAERLKWPKGALEECERLDGEHPGWVFCWMLENRIPGWERPAGFAASRPGWRMAGGDQFRRLPEDNVARQVSLLGPTVDELEGRIRTVHALYVVGVR